ncbi:MAG TPA: type I DNA topoisomerase [Armatimonadetes bacterium]|jgi:DNA topoisomerase-1|nr:type I DNA topoisomerase [Armatimonadota bacterium]
MSKSLIIVESPAKTKSLKSFLGSGFQIVASMGHVRDLPKTRLGVRVDHDFQPTYVQIPDRKETLENLRKAVQGADQVYLASDPDREGEAIAWHLKEALRLENPLRIEFNEITPQAVREALQHPRTLDVDRVNAQQARRVMDRLVGYNLSPLLWKKVKRNLSAGRVQSVAVRLIVDREAEIEAFVPVEYWSIAAMLTPLDQEFPFQAKLTHRAGKKVEVGTGDEAEAIVAALRTATYVVRSIKRRAQRRHPSPPFITSTLQQDAARKLGFSNRRTMSIAQQLYEGIDLGDEGTVGLITYMRTDSVRISQQALDEARAYIAERWGKEYIPATPRTFKSRKGAQDAHEAIRPTGIQRTPDAVKPYLTHDQQRLYRLIWDRFVACQMASAVFDVTTVEIGAGEFTLRAVGSVMKFPGFTILYTEARDTAEDEESAALPLLQEEQALKLIELLPRQHFTQPPPRYTEATLVKEMEEKGIGRPSTYASIIGTIQERGYVLLEEKKFRPTELGRRVTEFLVKHFPDIMEVRFTAAMESELDEVEEGKAAWVEVVRDFYDPFSRELTRAEEEAERVNIEPQLTDEPCPVCGRPMVIRENRFGRFLGCSGYPECKGTQPILKRVGVPCPKPECEGEIVEKRSRRGRVFYGCSAYPQCDFAVWQRPVNVRCPQCNSLMTEGTKRGGKGRYRKCLNRECAYTMAVEEEEQPAPTPA